MLHPGRRAFTKLPDNLLSLEEIKRELTDYFEGKEVALVPPEDEGDQETPTKDSLSRRKG